MISKHFQEFKKLINIKLALNCSKVKTPNRNGKWLYMCFRSEEDKNTALGILNGYNWKNTKLDASVSILCMCNFQIVFIGFKIFQNAKAVPDPLVKKRNEQFDECLDVKKIKLDNAGAEQQMISAVTPFYNISYDEQVSDNYLPIFNLENNILNVICLLEKLIIAL